LNRGDGPAIGLVAATALFSGCVSGHVDNPTSIAGQPSQVVGDPGTETSRVVLTASAADRLGIKAELVRALLPEQAGLTSTVVPVAALVYDEHGDTWVFTPVQGSPTNESGLPLTFARQRVTVARIEGGMAILQTGPAAGTLVVTVAVAELLGAEHGVEGG
jgi:hypothetical protein